MARNPKYNPDIERKRGKTSRQRGYAIHCNPWLPFKQREWAISPLIINDIASFFNDWNIGWLTEDELLKELKKQEKKHGVS